MNTSSRQQKNPRKSSSKVAIQTFFLRLVIREKSRPWSLQKHRFEQLLIISMRHFKRTQIPIPSPPPQKKFIMQF